MINEHKQPNSFIVVNEFNDESVEAFKSDFDRLRNQNMPVIPIYIDSFGGEVYSLFAMIDIIDSSHAEVATISIGKSMSAASVLLASGTPGLRFIGKHSTVMIHDAATFSGGKVEDMKVDVNELERLNGLMYEILAKKCGHRNKDYFRKIIQKKKHTNWYLTAEDTLNHGLVDHIGLPVIDSEFRIFLPNKK